MIVGSWRHGWIEADTFCSRDRIFNKLIAIWCFLD